MRLVPFTSSEPSIISDALVRRGLDPGRAEAVARGLRAATLLFDDVAPAEREALSAAAHAGGLQCLTGDDWALVAGGTSQLAGLSRPGFSTLPGPVAEAVGGWLRGMSEEPRDWEMARGVVSLARPVIAGILNVTPDSFSDGGRYVEPQAALRQAARLLDGGADMLDIGAESTRPGRPQAVSIDEEWRRLAPVLEGLSRRFPTVPLSVDTVKGEIARRALAEGVWAINDVSGLRLDPAIGDAVAQQGAGLILMHSRGSVADMATYDHAQYDDVATEVADELRSALRHAEDRGVARSAVVLDPGLGFAKRPEHNFALLHRLPSLAGLGRPIMVGPSRKRFLSNDPTRAPVERDGATAAVCAMAWTCGARIFRVHAPGPAREALDLAYAVASA